MDLIFRRLFSYTRQISVVIALFIIYTQFSYSQRICGKPYISNFTVKDYDGYHQNWAIIQDSTGFIYGANNNGVLIYDGSSWQLIPTKKRGTVRSLALGFDNKVYVGAQGEFGYLCRDSVGQWDYISLEEKLPDQKLKFDDVWRTHTDSSRIYFRTKQHIFCWDGKEITLIRSDNVFSNSFECNNQIYIYEAVKGISVVQNNHLVFLRGTEILVNKPVYVLLSLPGGDLLIGTGSDGFFRYNGKQCSRFVTEADDYIKEKKLYRGMVLPNRQIALGTLYGGLIIVNESGDYITQIDLKSGLVSEKIHDIFTDRQGSLWLALDNGIAHVSYPSPLTYWNDQDGVEGVVQKIIVHGGKVFAATNAGLFILDRGVKEGRLPRYLFQKFQALNTQVFDMTPVGSGFLCATKEGVVLIDNHHQKNISPKAAFILRRAVFDTSIFLAGKKDGVQIFRENNGSVFSLGLIKGINTEVRSILEIRDSVFWIGTKYEGVWTFRWNRQNPLEPVLTHFDTSHGLPSGYIQIFEVDQKPVFTGMNSVYQMDENRLHFSQDTVFLPAVRAVFSDMKGIGISPIYQENKDRVWTVIENRIAGIFIKSGKTWKFEFSRFGKIPKHAMIIAMTHDRAGTVWMGGSEGVILYDSSVFKTDYAPFRTVIRSVKTIADHKSLPFLGHAEYDYPFELEYSFSRIRIEYSALSYENEADNEYSLFLEGYDRNWSGWTKERYKEYMNLPEGNYTFRVRSKNIYQVLGEEASFVFSVLPPWYRSWWAYLIYTISGLGMFYLLIQLRVYVYRKRNIELENKVNERTHELKEAQYQLIQSEKAAALGQLVGGIAHEINNPLSVVDGNLYYFDDYIRKAVDLINEIDEKCKSLDSLTAEQKRDFIESLKQKYDFSFILNDSGNLLQSSRNSSQRIKKIVDDLRSLSGTDEQEQILSDIHDSIDHALHSLNYVPKTGISIIKEYQSVPGILCFPGLLSHAIRHILLNAIEAVGQQGQIIIATGKTVVEDNSDDSAKPYIRISIKDNGCGIPENIQKNIFDPFFTTKAVGQGTGLGLSISYQFIRRHEGLLRFSSRIHEGTTFEILLPERT